MKTIKLIAFAAMISATQAALSQDSGSSQATLPPGPLLNRAPDPSRWVISFFESPAAPQGTDATGTSRKSAKTKSVVVEKADNAYYEVTIDQTGREMETWRKGGFFLSKEKKSKEWSVSVAGAGDPFEVPDYSKTDFAGMDWISPQTFAGFKEYQGIKCMVFKGQVLPLNQNDLDIKKEFIDAQRKAEMLAGVKIDPVTDAPIALNTPKTKPFDPKDYMVPSEIFINLETRLPVIYKYGDKSRTYQYSGLSPSEVTVPNEAQSNVKDYLSYMMRLSARAAKP
ncbi:MAG: hypothetical protein WCO94_07240 [Verrucomicrobiota bacterium]